MSVIYLDTETVGLYGQPVLIQYAYDDGPVILHEVFRESILDTLLLIETMATNPDGICGFNLAFDWFMLCKCYTTLTLLGERVGVHEYPEDHIDLFGTLEAVARDGKCLKPVTACDLMLVARKGPYQSTMDRGDITIRRVPNILAYDLAKQLEHRIPIKDIYFAKKADKRADKWKVYDIKNEDESIDPNFKDVVLSFAPSSALKALVIDALGIEPDNVLLFADIGVPKVLFPEEYGYAPFATAIGNADNWRGAWPQVVRHHIAHWGSNPLARKYASKDVEYLPQLYRFFGSPPMGDDDSVLACMVATVRWKGFKVDIDGLKALKTDALVKAASTPTSSAACKRYIEQVLDPTEKHVLRGSTKKTILEDLRDKAIWRQVPCPVCDADGMVSFGEAVTTFVQTASDQDIDEALEYACEDEAEPVVEQSKGVCEVCDGKKFFRHPASIRAEEILDARTAALEVNLYDKLIIAGRLHASFKITGTLSNRMSGGDRLNAQGINKTKKVRKQFPLAFDGYQLCGGDFKSFEVVIADAVYNDPDLRRELQTKNVCTGCKGTGVDKGKVCADCDGTKICDQSIHAIFGTFVYPGYDYVGILNTKGTKDDKYTRSKSAVFAMLYGGEGYTLMDRLGVPIEVADAAYQRFSTKFQKVGEERRKVFDMFCSMRQDGGPGTKVEWNEPSDYIESVFGFRRYFTLENQICKALFELAQSPPRSWKETKTKVIRNKTTGREQTVAGASQSALFGAAFMLQASNMRAAANHVIQSAGAQVTKRLQRRLWDLQPTGINDFHLLTLNVHDEVLVPALPHVVPQITEVVNSVLDEFRPRVPLIAIDWSLSLNSWADK